jgi:hypothetical protein
MFKIAHITAIGLASLVAVSTVPAAAQTAPDQGQSAQSNLRNRIDNVGLHKSTYRPVADASQADVCDVSVSGIIWGVSTSEPAARAGDTSVSNSAAPSLRDTADSFSWGTSETRPPNRRRAPPSLFAHNIMVRACDQALSSLQALHADADATARLNQAFDASDGTTVTQIMTAAGFDTSILPGGLFHAINTKGTGSTNGRMSAGTPTQADAVCDGGYSLTIRDKNGHVTLMK